MSGNEERFQQAMNQGHSAAWDQEWVQAASFYRQALEQFPDHPVALTSLGLALFELQEYKESLKYYSQAARNTPDDPLPLEKIGDLYERMGNLSQANQVYLRAAELYAKNRDINKAILTWSRVTLLDPDHLVAHSRLAMVFEKMGRKADAIAEYLAVASLLQKAGEVPRAAQVLAHALQVMPTSQEVAQSVALLKAGKALPKPTRPRGATGPLLMAQVRKLEAAKEDKPEQSLDPVHEARQKALTDLAGLLFEGSLDDSLSGSTRRGLGAIMRGVDSQSANRQADQTKIMLHLTQTIDLQSRAKYSDAIVDLERAIEAGLEHPAAIFDLGLLMWETGRAETALRQLQRVVKHSDYALGTRLLLGQINHKLGRVKEAAIEYLEALRLADALIVPEEQAEELYHMYEPLVEGQHHQEDPQQQIHLCSNITELLLRPDWRSHLKQARQQLPAAEDGAPIPLAEILAASRGSLVVEAISRIHQYSRLGYYRAAMDEAFFALQHAPTYLPLHTQIGELLLQQNRIDSAVVKFTVVANAYKVRGDVKRSVDFYRRITEMSPMDMQSRNRLIEQLIAMGKINESIKEYLTLADMYYNQADLSSARKTYTQALRVAQQSNIERHEKANILHRMADIDLQSMDWRQALRVYEQIRTLLPDDENARSRLIELNFRLGQTTQALAELDNFISFLWSNSLKDRAVKFLEVLIGEHQNQTAIRRRLAELYRQTGRTNEAIAQLDTVSDMLMAAGDKAGAVETIRLILSLNPPNSEDYQQLLNQVKSSS